LVYARHNCFINFVVLVIPGWVLYMSAATKTNHVLDGRTLWVPRMSDSGARFFAAVFRSIGIDASATPESNEDTLELGGLHTSGEECYPSKVTMGDFLRIVHADDFDPMKHAFFMPTANGPCRFGQYAPYLRTVLDKLGHTSVPIISPTSENGYDGLDDHDNSMIMSLWRGMVCGDILKKMLLRYVKHFRNYRGVPIT